MDALTFLTRRLDRLPVLLVLTYRDDETGATSPLWRVLGGLRAPVAVRVPLSPLSPQAVMRLAGEHGRGLRLHASTGGNPFFVTELLAAEDEGVPASVSQAVLARVARLPEPTRALLELLAVVPARTEATVLDVLCPDWVDDAAPPRSGGCSPSMTARWRSATSWPAARSRSRSPRCAPGDSIPGARGGACGRSRRGPARAPRRTSRGRRDARRGRAARRRRRGDLGGPSRSSGALPARAAPRRPLPAPGKPPCSRPTPWRPR